MPACREGAQIGRDLPEQATISGAIAVLSPSHQNPPIAFAGGARLRYGVLLTVLDHGPRRRAAARYRTAAGSRRDYRRPDASCRDRLLRGGLRDLAQGVPGRDAIRAGTV